MFVYLASLSAFLMPRGHIHCHPMQGAEVLLAISCTDQKWGSKSGQMTCASLYEIAHLIEWKKTEHVSFIVYTCNSVLQMPSGKLFLSFVWFYLTY